MTNSHHLCIVADDFGVSDGVNRAVMHAHQTGTLPSASLAATGVAAEEAFALALSTPSLEVGVHFVLAAGRPLSDPDRLPTLVDRTGRFVSRSALLKRAITGRLARAEVAIEVEEQLAAFVGRCAPSFLNGDQHIQVLPVISDVLIEIARRERLPLRIPTERVVFLRWWLGARGAARLGAKVMLNTLARRLRRRLGRESHDARLISPFGLFPSPRFDLQAFATLLNHLGSGINELMVHPAYPDSNLAEFWVTGERNLASRKEELDVLLDPQFRELLAERKIILTKISESGARE